MHINKKLKNANFPNIYQQDILECMKDVKNQITVLQKTNDKESIKNKLFESKMVLMIMFESSDIDNTGFIDFEKVKHTIFFHHCLLTDISKFKKLYKNPRIVDLYKTDFLSMVYFSLSNYITGERKEDSLDTARRIKEYLNYKKLENSRLLSEVESSTGTKHLIKIDKEQKASDHLIEPKKLNLKRKESSDNSQYTMLSEFLKNTEVKFKPNYYLKDDILTVSFEEIYNGCLIQVIYQLFETSEQQIVLSAGIYSDKNKLNFSDSYCLKGYLLNKLRNGTILSEFIKNINLNRTTNIEEYKYLGNVNILIRTNISNYEWNALKTKYELLEFVQEGSIYNLATTKDVNTSQGLFSLDVFILNSQKIKQLNVRYEVVDCSNLLTIKVFAEKDSREIDLSSEYAMIILDNSLKIMENQILFIQFFKIYFGDSGLFDYERYVFNPRQYTKLI